MNISIFIQYVEKNNALDAVTILAALIIVSELVAVVFPSQQLTGARNTIKEFASQCDLARAVRGWERLLKAVFHLDIGRELRIG